jgi:hypothetical protein
MSKRFWVIRLLALFTLLLHHQHEGTASPLQPQTRDDHNDNGSIQTGYVVVTPSLGATGVAVLESFGLRQQDGTTQSSMTPPVLITSGVLFVNESTRLSKDIGIAIVNPNNGVATVTLTVRKNDGSQLQTQTIQIPTRRQFSQFLTQIFAPAAQGGTGLPAEFTGTVQVDSTVPISVVGIRFRGLNFSAIPLIPLAVSTVPLPILTSGVGGTGASLLPVLAVDGRWATELILINTNTSSVTVRLDLYNEDSSALTTAFNGQTVSSITNVVIPARGIVVYAPRDRNGDDDF